MELFIVVSILAWITLTIFATIFFIGKPRTPITAGQAGVALVVYFLIGLGVIYLAQH